LHAAGNVLFRTWLVSFYVINAGSATGVDRGVQVVWAAALANLAYATLITWVLVTHRDGTSIGDGAITGAIVGFLMWLTVDFNLYSSSHIANLLRTMVDPVLEAIRGGLGGAAIAAVLRVLRVAARRTA
jgi:hypothetical protein